MKKLVFNFVGIHYRKTNPFVFKLTNNSDFPLELVTNLLSHVYCRFSFSFKYNPEIVD